MKHDRPDSPDDETRAEELRFPEAPGAIGPYRLLEKLGEGGMGEVWLAEQTEPVRREVALKIIKEGMDTKHVVARFEAERQALALMDHAAIAKVFDAGATSHGRPYFVMERVRGVPINEHCDRHKLSVRERLELFILVCDGVQHAHQKAVIHRDLKPSNVLVTVQDGKPLPKIIDFGVAKATAQKLTDRTMHTQLGMMIGTPDYMSPEQAEMTGQDIDTRTDVYALGVILYELLVGALPFDSRELRQAGFVEIARRIREDEPPKPSTRLGTLGEGSTNSAARRQVDVPALRRQLSGDLDWVTMKALEKDRVRRYGSPTELADDIRRHLRHEPVVAGRPGRAYRAKKFIRRHRVGVGVAALVGSTLVLGMVGTATGLVRARRAEVAARAAEVQARSEAAAATRISDFLVGLFAVSEPGEARGNTVTAREILDRGVDTIQTQLEDDPLVHARLMATMGSVYRSLGLYDEARPLLELSVSKLRETAGEDDPRTLDARGTLAGLAVLSGDTVGARKILDDLVPRVERVFGGDSPEAARAVNNLAALLLKTGDHERALPLLERSLAIREKTLGPDHSDVAKVLTNLGFVRRKLKDFKGARRDLERAVAIRETLFGADHPDTVKPLVTLGLVLADLGDRAGAKAKLEAALAVRLRTLGPEHPDTRDVEAKLRSL